LKIFRSKVKRQAKYSHRPKKRTLTKKAKQRPKRLKSGNLKERRGKLHQQVVRLGRKRFQNWTLIMRKKLLQSNYATLSLNSQTKFLTMSIFSGQSQLTLLKSRRATRRRGKKFKKPVQPEPLQSWKIRAGLWRKAKLVVVVRNQGLANQHSE
jgi:hypothetical protein